MTYNGKKAGAYSEIHLNAIILDIIIPLNGGWNFWVKRLRDQARKRLVPEPKLKSIPVLKETPSKPYPVLW